MTRVWVDVGGTFTDCIVCDAVSPVGDRRCLKVLSSGVVRAHVTEILSANRYRLRFAAHDSHSFAVQDFWRGAAISLLSDGRPPARLGTITSQTTDGEISVEPTTRGPVATSVIRPIFDRARFGH